ncbi:MAG: hypothetical protein DRJ03_20610 [Chloroflexi bacterium]|nr:MAG: hypothetical protein DRI81_10720 [Chloroflexota bacterium]RLC81085.1 MAG: hypothetical protein DRJ03_20610 [Chloroflexota bacterium]
MKRMRFLVAILVIWLFIFFNIERLSSPIDITDVAYTFVPFTVTLIIFAPRLRRVPLGAFLTASTLVFLLLKTWFKSHVWGSSLPLTVTEICIIAVAIILARWVSNGIGEFERAITHITIGHNNGLPESFSDDQAKMYQELKRARRYQRPLTMMAIGIEEDSIQVALERMVREAQQVMMKRYVMSDIAKTLCDELEDYNIIAQNNNHFLVLLPEVAAGQLPDLSNQLRETLFEQTRVAPQIGTASFPDDAVTFDDLVEKATEAMKRQRNRTSYCAGES